MISLYPFKSYEEYTEAQTRANWEKRTRVFTSEPTVALLAAFVREVNPTPSFGLCHGTRTGAEQVWFRAALPGCDVWGTELGPTAETAPFTVQWDFHDVNPIWLGHCDFVYSNSLDHAYDPARAVRSWLSCLKRTGLLLIEREGRIKSPLDADPVDCFRAAPDTFKALLEDWGAEVLHAKHLPKSNNRWYYVARRTWTT